MTLIEEDEVGGICRRFCRKPVVLPTKTLKALGIQFTLIPARESQCPFGQIETRKRMWGKVKIAFSENVLTCRLKEDTEVYFLLKVRPHRSPMVLNYGQLKMLALMRF